jgi:hypothetical protein
MQLRTSKAFLPSTLPSTQDCAYHLRKVRVGLSSIRPALSWPNLALYLCRLRASVRSFRAHIGIQLSTARGVQLGPAFQFQAGQTLPNERTYARAEGIRKLQATHPWLDNVDLQLFLTGFDAGEEYNIRAQGQHPSNLDRQPNQMQQ